MASKAEIAAWQAEYVKLPGCKRCGSKCGMPGCKVCKGTAVCVRCKFANKGGK